MARQDPVHMLQHTRIQIISIALFPFVAPFTVYKSLLFGQLNVGVCVDAQLLLDYYLKFANKWWRIIRINGDGTIRIIYDGTAYHANGTSTTESCISIDSIFICCQVIYIPCLEGAHYCTLICIRVCCSICTGRKL